MELDRAKYHSNYTHTEDGGSYEFQQFYQEVCCVCGDHIITYQSSGVINTTESWFKRFPDVVVGDKIWHICSIECKEMFSLNPLPYIEWNRDETSS